MSTLKESMRQSKVWPHVLALLLYAIVVLWLTRPLVSHLDVALAGSSTDAFMHYWNGWWVRQALATGQSIFDTNYLFFPEGVSLAYHNFAWLSIIPWLALQQIVADLLAYNIIFLLNLVFCGYAAFLLAGRLTANRLAAFIAGLVYLAWPYRLSQLDHPNLISTGWIPLFMLFLIMSLQGGRRRDAVLAGLCLALVGFTRWQLLIPMVIVIGAYLLGTLPDWIKSRQRWLSLAITAGVTLLLLAPPAWLLFGRQDQSPTDAAEVLLREGEEAIMQTDLLAFVTPPASQPLVGQTTEPLFDHYYPERTTLRRFPVYLGLATLCLAAIAIWRRPRLCLPWLLMALLLMLLALGPIWRLNGRLYPDLPTLYRALEPLYFIRLLRIPERFNIVLALPVAVLAGYGLSVILSWRQNRHQDKTWLPFATAAILSLIILFEYDSGDILLQSTNLPAYYEQLAADPDQTAILSLPIDALQAKEQMLAQTVHGLPLVHGRITRPPAGAYSFIDQHPLLSVLRRNSEMPPWLTDVSGQLASLAAEGISTIIFHKDQIGADRIDHWRRYLSLSPVYEDEQIAVFSTEPKANQDFHTIQELEPGLGPVQSLMTSDCLEPGQPLEVDILWGTSSDLVADSQVQIGLQSQAGELLQLQSFPLESPEPGVVWPADSLLWGYYPLDIELDTPAGHHGLFLQLDDAPSPQMFSLGPLTVGEDACPSDLPESTKVVDALFGHQMRLLGYEIQRAAPDQLEVLLYWRDEQRMGTDYKVFVHVFAPDTGVPVAQDDAMPHRGGFPTRFWAPGDVIVDRIPIDLGGAPTGAYGLAVGVYDPLTQERLPLLIDGQQQPEDSRLVLPGDTVEIEP